MTARPGNPGGKPYAGHPTEVLLPDGLDIEQLHSELAAALPDDLAGVTLKGERLFVTFRREPGEAAREIARAKARAHRPLGKP